MTNRNTVLFILLSSFINSVIAGGGSNLEKLLPKEEKVGDWKIETYKYPYNRTTNTDITAYIETDNGSVYIECLHGDKYASITFYILSLGVSFQEQYVDIKVSIDGNDAIHFLNKKSLVTEIYVSDYDVPYSKEVAELLKQMRKGNVMVFEVTGAKKGISNEISLKGFAKAYNVLEKSCTEMVLS